MESCSHLGMLACRNICLCSLCLSPSWSPARTWPLAILRLCSCRYALPYTSQQAGQDTADGIHRSPCWMFRLTVTLQKHGAQSQVLLASSELPIDMQCLASASALLTIFCQFSSCRDGYHVSHPGRAVWSLKLLRGTLISLGWCKPDVSSRALHCIRITQFKWLTAS